MSLLTRIHTNITFFSLSKTIFYFIFIFGDKSTEYGNQFLCINYLHHYFKLLDRVHTYKINYFIIKIRFEIECRFFYTFILNENIINYLLQS